MIVAAVILLANSATHRGVPQYPSLRSQPDPSLSGTVAYVTTGSCIEVVSASGSRAKQVLCLQGAEQQKGGPAATKLIGPQLVWRADGRLEVTMFRMSMSGHGEAPTYSAGWQKVIDVRTGAVQQTPTADLPSTWDTSTRPTVGPAGQRLIVTNARDGSGKVSITLTQAGHADRTLLSAHGPGEYTYHLYSAFWSPDRQWIAADDGRILILTLGDPVVTRVLADDLASGGFNEDPARSNFAITAADVLGR